MSGVTAQAVTAIVNLQTKSTLRSTLDSVEKAFDTSPDSGGKGSALCVEIKGIIKDRFNRGADTIKARVFEKEAYPCE